MAKTEAGKWRVQVGKGKGAYQDRYTFSGDKAVQAEFHYRCLNTHSGYKKRLINPEGKVVKRQL